MAQEINTGKYGSGFYQGDVADRRLVIDMSKKIHMLSPTDTPFYVMLANAKKELATNAKFEWMEDEYFTLRTFMAKFHVTSTATDGFGYLELLNPNDVQGLEAPPYMQTAASYDTTDTILVKLTIDNDADGSYGVTGWVILEKGAVENAGVWRTIEPDTVGSILGGITFDESTDITGYVLPVAMTDGAGTINLSSCLGWHGDTTGSIGTAANLNECIIVGSSGATGTTPIDSGTNSQVAAGTDEAMAVGNYNCKVQVYTPNLLNKGYYEGSGLPEESRKGVRLMDNYTQISKTPFTITNTAIATSYVGGDELARLRARKAIQHKIDLEQILMFNGAKAIDASTSESPKRTTQGLGIGLTDKSGFIKTHHPGTATASANSDYAIGNTAALFYPDLSEAFQNIFSDAIVGSGTKILFVSQKWLGAFTNNASTSSPFPITFDTTPGAANATYGLSVMKWRSAFGLVNIVAAPVLRGFYEDYAAVIDFSNVAMKVLPGRDTHIVTNAQGPDEDGLKEYLLTEMGLKCMHEHTHAILRLTAS